MTWRMNGRKNMSINVMAADVRMEYTTVMRVICHSRLFHLLECPDEGWLRAVLFMARTQRLGNRRSSSP